MVVEQDRTRNGRFTFKGDDIRGVRSIRLTDNTWEALGEKAGRHDMTRADYIEALFAGEIEWEGKCFEADRQDLDFDPDEVAKILRQALTLKANVGGKIKLKIREALQLMGFDPDEES